MGCSSSSSSATTAGIHQKYALGKGLGRGSFGEVRLARSRESNERWAVKVLDLRADRKKRTAPASEAMVKSAKNECATWHLAGKHPNIVELREVFFEGPLCYMVSELCECDLMSRLDDLIDEESGFHRIFCEMLRGIAHIHGAGIVHRDVKPHNFLMVGQREQTVKLADFGEAVAMPSEGLLLQEAGTTAFMSPEMLGGSGYDYKTDLWSLGVTAYFFLFGGLPYEPPLDSSISLGAMRQVFAAKRRAPKFEPMDADWPRHNRVAGEFASALLQRQTHSRPSATEALTLPYLSTPEPVAREEYLERKHAMECRNASLSAAHCNNCSQELKPLGRILAKLQSSPTLRSFRRSHSGTTQDHASHTADALAVPPASPNSGSHLPHLLTARTCNDASTSASSDGVSDKTEVPQPLGKFKLLI